MFQLLGRLRKDFLWTSAQFGSVAKEALQRLLRFVRHPSEPVARFQLIAAGTTHHCWEAIFRCDLNSQTRPYPLGQVHVGPIAGPAEEVIIIVIVVVIIVAATTAAATATARTRARRTGIARTTTAGPNGTRSPASSTATTTITTNHGGILVHEHDLVTGCAILVAFSLWRV